MRMTRWLWFVMFMSLYWLTPTAHSQAPEPADQPIDVLLVLDDSGSMGTCWPWGDEATHVTNGCAQRGQSEPSDRDNLRYSAAKLLVQLADEEDRIMVIRFDSDVEPVGARAFQRVGGPDSRAQIIAALNPPANYDGRGYTRIDLGLEQAVAIFQQQRAPDRQSYVVFLTDGTPTQPKTAQPQEGSIASSATTLRQMGVRLFPVALCSPDNSACPKAFLERLLGATREAREARDLLRVFSEIFAEMKPTLHVIDHATAQNGDGDLELQTRQAHGARQLNVVTTKDGFGGLLRDASLQSTQTLLQDSNVAVNTIESSVLPDGRWTVKANEASVFVVARTETYPQLIHPVPSISGSAAGERYVPKGKSPLIVASTVGPGGGEPLIYNGVTPLQPLTPDKTAFWTVLPQDAALFSIQVGNDTRPLQIKRQFQVIGRDNLPTAQASLPTCAAETNCLLTVDFSPGPEIADPQGTVYISELQPTDGGAVETPIYVKPMTCAERQCSDQGFIPKNGRRYKIRYLVSASSGDVHYSDWTEVDLTMSPAVYVRGLPNPLTLAGRAENSWPVTVIARTTQDLGQFSAALQLKRQDTGEQINTLSVAFSVDIRGESEQETTLRILGGERLRPGTYEGALTFSVARQAESEPVDLPAPIPIQFTLRKPTATIDLQHIDFGEAPFDPAVTFRIDQKQPLPVTFADASFPISVTLETSSCPELSLTSNLSSAQAGQPASLELRLQSDGPVQPQTCSGKLTLAPAVPNPDDYVIQASITRTWQIKIVPIAWQVVGIERDGKIVDTLAFDRLGSVGQKQSAVLVVDYTGPPDFSLTNQDFTNLTTGLQGGDLRLETSPAQPVPDRPHRYRVPITLVALRSLPHGPIWGTQHQGALNLGITALPSQPASSINFTFYTPSLPERYIFPPIVSVYGTWLPFWLPGICTGPVTLMAVLLTASFWRARRIRKTVEGSRPVPSATDEYVPTPPEPRSPKPPKPPKPPTRESGSAMPQRPTPPPGAAGARRQGGAPPSRPGPASGGRASGAVGATSRPGSPMPQRPGPPPGAPRPGGPARVTPGRPAGPPRPLTKPERQR
jgi:hypothetical protein